MKFHELKGEDGVFFSPEATAEKKYPCADCFSCQWCSDDRCDLCLSEKKKKGKRCSGHCGKRKHPSRG